MSNQEAMWFDDLIDLEAVEENEYIIQFRPAKSKPSRAPSEKLDTKRYRREAMPHKKSRRQREKQYYTL